MLSTLPARNQEGSQAVEPKTIAEAWTIALHGVPDVVLHMATDKILQGATNGWFPNPAQLRGVCDNVQSELDAEANGPTLAIDRENEVERRKRAMEEFLAQQKANAEYASAQNKKRQEEARERWGKFKVVEGGEPKVKRDNPISRVVADIAARKSEAEQQA